MQQSNLGLTGMTGTLSWSSMFKAWMTDIPHLCVQRILQYDKQTGLNSLRELNPKLASIALQKDEQLYQVHCALCNGSMGLCVPVHVQQWAILQACICAEQFACMCTELRDVEASTLLASADRWGLSLAVLP